MQKLRFACVRVSKNFSMGWASVAKASSLAPSALSLATSANSTSATSTTSVTSTTSATSLPQKRLRQHSPERTATTTTTTTTTTTWTKSRWQAQTALGSAMGQIRKVKELLDIDTSLLESKITELIAQIRTPPRATTLPLPIPPLPTPPPPPPITPPPITPLPITPPPRLTTQPPPRSKKPTIPPLTIPPSKHTKSFGPREEKLVIILNTPLESIDSKATRDKFNRALKAIVVATVTKSANGNIVVLTTDSFTIDYLLTRKAAWRWIFEDLSVKDI